MAFPVNLSDHSVTETQCQSDDMALHNDSKLVTTHSQTHNDSDCDSQTAIDSSQVQKQLAEIPGDFGVPLVGHNVQFVRDPIGFIESRVRKFKYVMTVSL
jgi:hypothetical protein